LLSKNIKTQIHRTIILPVVSHEHETLLLTLREERRMRMFENRVLRRIFGPKRGEVTGECRKLYDKERNDPYRSPNISLVTKSRRKRWAGQAAHMGERCIQGFCGET
jgi:hypothetical protein